MRLESGGRGNRGQSSATTAAPLGLGPELRLAGLGEEELAAALGVADAEAARAL